MRIVSYRGRQIGTDGKPKAAGGVSAALSRILELNPHTKWLYLDSNRFQITGQALDSTKTIRNLPKDLMTDHYAFCNRVLWPICHGLGQFIEYRPSDHTAYRSFQRRLAHSIAGLQSTENYFLQDYQLSLLPGMLKIKGIQSTLFWHIPFQRDVEDRFVEVVKEMVRGMLGAKVIGFHCQAYADNFVHFVRNHLALQYFADTTNNTVRRRGGAMTQVVVAPLGIDVANWGKLAKAHNDVLDRAEVGKTLFLSVARADYTKGIPELLEAWEHFLHLRPAQATKSVLRVIVTPTRDGVKAFDLEWKRIEAAHARIDRLYPGSVIWQTKPVPPEELAVIYANTSVLLVPAHVDGWNLTGPEFAACQLIKRGAVMAMSRGTGAFAKFGEYVTELTPSKPHLMGAQIAEAFDLIGTTAAIKRMRSLKAETPTIDEWVADFKAHAGLTGGKQAS
jgi:trehalose 6-phosphate synthase